MKHKSNLSRGSSSIVRNKPISKKSDHSLSLSEILSFGTGSAFVGWAPLEKRPELKAGDFVLCRMRTGGECAMIEASWYASFLYVYPYPLRGQMGYCFGLRFNDVADERAISDWILDEVEDASDQGRRG